MGIISERLKSLGLSLNSKKTSIQPITHGIHFLGFSFKLSNTGKVYINLLKGKASKERRRLRKMAELLPSKQVKECYESWRNFVNKGNTYRVLTVMDDYCRKVVT